MPRAMGSLLWHGSLGMPLPWQWLRSLNDEESIFHGPWADVGSLGEGKMLCRTLYCSISNGWWWKTWGGHIPWGLTLSLPVLCCISVFKPHDVSCMALLVALFCSLQVSGAGCVPVVSSHGG